MILHDEGITISMEVNKPLENDDIFVSISNEVVSFTEFQKGLEISPNVHIPKV